MASLPSLGLLFFVKVGLEGTGFLTKLTKLTKFTDLTRWQDFREVGCRYEAVPWLFGLAAL
jgi:hypothetical protein